MALGHEKLDVYQRTISYVAWVYEKAAALEGVHRAARDQWLRASQSIPYGGDAESAGWKRCQVQESEEACAAGGEGVDPDPDSDTDMDEIKPQQSGGGDLIPPPHY